MRRAYFVIVHSSMSAAIIHLVNISSPNSIEAANLLSENIRMLHEMHPTYPIMAQYFKVIRGLIAKWVPIVPSNVRDALHATADLPSPFSFDSTSPVGSSSHATFSTNFDDPSTSSIASNGKRKASIPPDLAQMTPHLHNGENTTAPREFLWTPFPESYEGMPVMPPERRTSNDYMNISRMLDSGVDGDSAQLNRDGFTIDPKQEVWGV